MRIEPPGDDGLCSVPFGTTKTSPCAEADRALGPVGVTQRDVELAVDDQEKLVGVGVHVPDVLALGVGDPDVVVVHPGDDARAVDLVERAQSGVQVDWLGFHDATFP